MWHIGSIQDEPEISSICIILKTDRYGRQHARKLRYVGDGFFVSLEENYLGEVLGTIDYWCYAPGKNKEYTKVPL